MAKRKHRHLKTDDNKLYGGVDSGEELARQIVMHAEHYLSDAKLFYDRTENFQPARNHRYMQHHSVSLHSGLIARVLQWSGARGRAAERSRDAQALEEALREGRIAATDHRRCDSTAQ